MSGVVSERDRILLAAIYGGAFDEAFDEFVRSAAPKLRVKKLDEMCLGVCCVDGKLGLGSEAALRRAVESLLGAPTNRVELGKILGRLASRAKGVPADHERSWL